MRRYVLIPKDADNSVWEASSVKSPIEIEADSEDEARNRAALEYMQMVKPQRLGGKNLVSPWEDENFSECRLISGE